MHATDQHRFAYSRTAAEQLLADASAQEAHAPPLQFVSSIDPAAFGGDFVAHLAVLRTDAAYGGSTYHAIAVADARPLDCFQTGMLHERRVGFDHVEIGLFQHDLLPCALPARLLARLLRPADHNAFSKGIESAHQDVAEAAAVRN